MNSLRHFLESRPSTTVLWIAPDIGDILCADLLAFAASVSQSVQELRGKRVAISDLPPLELLAALVVLDGAVSGIFLLPIEVDKELIRQLSAERRIDFFLEGEGFGFLNWIKREKNTFNASAKKTEYAVSLDAVSEWFLPTSGTTGQPKIVQHDLFSLTRSIKIREIGDQFRWASLYSFRRFAGLQVFLQSVLNATPLIVLDDKLSLAERVDILRKSHCNALSATPSMWRKLIMTPALEQMDLRQITLGGEIADQALLGALGNLFPDARITHVYASTEAGVGFSVNDGKAGFPAEWLIKNSFGVDLAVSGDGELKIRRHQSLRQDSSWISTGDLVRIDTERVYFLGRANGSINVGGNKVMPEEVEAVINGVTGVAFAQVRGRKNPILGQLVEAVVTPEAGVDFNASLKKAIIETCRTKLEPFKVPAFLIEGGAVELTPTGKVSRT